MRVKLQIESLKCTVGTSNKGYQIIRWYLNGVLSTVTKIYGPLGQPNQALHHQDAASELDHEAFKTLKQKLKKYNRAHPMREFEWSGDPAAWRMNGRDWVEQAAYVECDLWQTNCAGKAQPIDRITEGVNALVRLVDDDGAATDAAADRKAERELFSQRLARKREQELEEAKKMDNWGAF